VIKIKNNFEEQINRRKQATKAIQQIPYLWMMRKIYLLYFILLFFGQNAFSQKEISYTVNYFHTLPNIQIRALKAISNTKAWFASGRGIWGYTEDAGATWHIDSIKVDTAYPQFRSIAVLNDSTVLLLSIASPAYLFKTTNKGKTWKLVYKNSAKDIFFDSMIFYTSKDGLAISDPLEGCFQLIKTDDAGETWKQMDCTKIPKAEKGEACFASSNTNIVVHAKNIWFATGGANARVLHSVDMGNHFRAYNSPMPVGGQLTGIFSIDFFDETTGVIAGGEYNKPDSAMVSLATSQDGGISWKPFKTNKPIFGSCVQFKNHDEFYVTGDNGTYKCFIDKAQIIELRDKAGNELKYTTLSFSSDEKSLWLAGDNGAIALINLNSDTNH
jgi:photosystem II stability/assembly factor-like uncharacterized protein